ncbi:MAG TPA: hypothetical protein PLJ27_25570, partial [Polyangiaceae bacterium]|nr:hypothetical protein [Polyangiaceae bacterium]
GGSSADGGSAGNADGGAGKGQGGADSGTAPQPYAGDSEEQAGCACRAPKNQPQNGKLALFALFFAAYLTRRTRRTCEQKSHW